MDASLLITVAVIFVATLVGSALRGLRKDRCLTDFDGFHVTVEDVEEGIIWGTMELESTGLELDYRKNVVDARMSLKTSYVYYKDEYENIQAIYRFADDLTPENRDKRDRSCEKAFHPGLMFYIGRRVRNYINTATDSLAEALSLVAVGRTKGVTNQTAMKSGQTHLKGLTKNILGYVGTSYDPLLESFIGAQVVVELVHNGEVYEYVGLLKDYTSTFLEVLDVYFSRPITVTPAFGQADLSATRPVAETLHMDAASGVLATLDRHLLYVKNEAPYPLLLGSIDADGTEIKVNRVLDTYEEMRYALGSGVERVKLHCTMMSEVDMILPRSRTLIRHRAEQYQATDAFDVRARLNEIFGEDVDQNADEVDDLLLNRDHVAVEDQLLWHALEVRKRSAVAKDSGAGAD